MILLLVLTSLPVLSQQVPITTDNTWIVLFEWQQSKNGIWTKSQGHRLERKPSKIFVISHDVERCIMFATDQYGCYKVELQPNWSAYVKNEYNQKNLAEDVLKDELTRIENEMDCKFQKLNEETNRIKHDKEVAEQRFRDSINNVRIKEHAKMVEKYKESHSDWKKLPVASFENRCLLCDTRSADDAIGLSGDTIFTIEHVNGGLNHMYNRIHAFVLTNIDKNRLENHIDAFIDSLKVLNLSMLLATKYNYEELLSNVDIIKQDAPYGFFSSWGWKAGNPFSMSFWFSFQNMNKKTIRYIEVFFRVKNAVGDIRNTGSFKGTGPVEYLECGSWNWDHSQYTLAGDASEADITKVIITYMDKTQKILTGKMIRFDN